jgi:aminopeptidase N
MLAAISYEAAADSFRLPDLVRPEHYDLALTPVADLRSFRGHERIDLQVRQSTTRIQLNAVELTFERGRTLAK